MPGEREERPVFKTGINEIRMMGKKNLCAVFRNAVKCVPHHLCHQFRPSFSPHFRIVHARHVKQGAVFLKRHMAVVQYLHRCFAEFIFNIIGIFIQFMVPPHINDAVREKHRAGV